jgi:hypothetical protein
MSCSFVVGVSLAIGLVQPPAPDELTPEERREGYELLFDGTSLTNWHARSLVEKPATWRARDGILSYEPGDSWLASDRTFTDFIDVDLDDPAYAKALRGPLSARSRSGHVGFQAHLTGAPVEFRRIRIKRIE